MAALNARDIFIQGDLTTDGIYPRLLSQTYNAKDLTITLEGTYIVVKLEFPTTTSSGDEFKKPDYITNYTVKLWRTGETTGTNTTDWWDTTWDSGNMLKVTTLDIARFDLLQLSNTPVKRISQNGINYQIAIRSTDVMGFISSKSILGSIRIKTISV
jgi:hypothetical protein